MKHLVISVSPDSSLKLLENFADVIMLDKKPLLNNIETYKTLYIRSHFSQPETMPQNFHYEINTIVNKARNRNPDIRFIDGMNNIDDIVAFEDKWRQYQIFRDLMPPTQLYGKGVDISAFKRPIFKRRLSSRGSGVTWNVNDVTGSLQDWIIQESLDLDKEIRIYVVHGNVYPIATIRRSMSSQQATHAVDYRKLNLIEIEFANMVAEQVPSMDIIGLDVAQKIDGKLSLMEVNRSPGFAAFADLTNINLASILYAETS